MKLKGMRFLAALVLLFSAAATAAHAQMPQDNEVWKARCKMLNGLAATIDAGNTPPVLAAATHGLPSIQFAEFGFDRSRATEHNVACTMFYMAAIAERAGNITNNPKTAHNLIVVAQSEYALAHGRKVTALQHVKRGEEEAKQVGAKHMDSAQSEAVLQATSTFPITTSAH